jgi:hypothetical protein
MAVEHSSQTSPRVRRNRRSIALGLVAAFAGSLTTWGRRALAQGKGASSPDPRHVGPLVRCTVGELRRTIGVPGQIALIACHTVVQDDGGGMFCWQDDVHARDDDGMIIVPSGARTGCWRRVGSGPMNVRWFGARGDGITNDDRAFANAIAAARTGGLSVYAPRGRYKLTKLGGLDCGFSFSGDGPTSTILCGDTRKDHVVELTKRSLNRLTLRDFGVSGGVTFEPNPEQRPAKVFHGIYLHDNNFAFEVNISNVAVESCTGAGIRDEGGCFSSTISSVTVDGCGGGGIDLKGGCCTTLINCYVLNIARDQAAYRIALGTPVMIACNGINHNNGLAENTTWAEFGLGPGSQCLPTLLGCNVESFTEIGCNFGGGSFGNFIGTTILPAVPRRTLALRYAHVPHDIELGIWDGTSRIYGAAANGGWGSKRWGAHGHPIEAFGNPFVSLNKSVAGLGAYVKDGDRDLHSTIPSVTSTTSASCKCSLDLSSAVIRDVHLPPTAGAPRGKKV